MRKNNKGGWILSQVDIGASVHATHAANMSLQKTSDTAYCLSLQNTSFEYNLAALSYFTTQKLQEVIAGVGITTLCKCSIVIELCLRAKNKSELGVCFFLMDNVIKENS